MLKYHKLKDNFNLHCLFSVSINAHIKGFQSLNLGLSFIWFIFMLIIMEDNDDAVWA